MRKLLFKCIKYLVQDLTAKKGEMWDLNFSSPIPGLMLFSQHWRRKPHNTDLICFPCLPNTYFLLRSCKVTGSLLTTCPLAFITVCGTLLSFGNVSLLLKIKNFLGCCFVQWDCWVIWWFYIQFSEEPPYSFP